MASEVQEAVVKERNVALQANMVLMQKYCDRMRGQIETLENNQGKGKRKRLHTDGIPHLLTEDNFFGHVCVKKRGKSR